MALVEAWSAAAQANEDDMPAVQKVSIYKAMAKTMKAKQVAGELKRCWRELGWWSSVATR